MEIFELSERMEFFDKAVNYFWSCWGNEKNHNFYEDCMKHSLDSANSIPKFYIALEGDEIIASYALIVNDLISRQDLVPWFACLFVNEEHRNKGIAEALLNHALSEGKRKNYDNLYLSTDLENFYEAKGWEEIGKGFGFSGGDIKIYSKSTS